MKSLFTVLLLFATCFSDSYQKCVLLKIKAKDADTICFCKNIKTQGLVKVAPNRIKERPLRPGKMITVRNVPYKRHKEIVFEMPVEDLVIPDVIE